MARLNAEPSTAYLPIDMSVAPGQKANVTSSAIGAFDEALRHAARTDREAAAPPNQEFSNTDPPTEAKEHSKAREPAEPEENRDREIDDKHVEDSDAPVHSDDEVKPSDDRESDDVAAENRPDSAEDAKSEEPDDAASEDEASAEAIVPVLPVTDPTAAEEPVAETNEGTTHDSEVVEQLSPDERPAKSPKKGAESTKTKSMSAELKAEQPTTEPTVESPAEEAVNASEIVAEEVTAAAELTSEEAVAEEPRSKKEREAVEEKTARPTRDSEKPLIGETALPDAATVVGEELPIPPLEEPSGKRVPPRRNKKSDVASMPAAQVRQAPDAVGQVSDAAASVPEDQSEKTPADTASAAPVARTTPTIELGAQSNANQAPGAVQSPLATESGTDSRMNPTSAARNSGQATSQGVDAAKFVQRVAGAFSALGQRTGPIRLKLYPPELGSLRMEISVKSGALSARVEADTAAAKTLLLDNLPMLRHRLAEQGIKVDRFDVGVSDQPQGGLPERPNDGGRSFHQADRGTASCTPTNDSEAEPAERWQERRFGSDGRIDVFI